MIKGAWCSGGGGHRTLGADSRSDGPYVKKRYLSEAGRTGGFWVNLAQEGKPRHRGLAFTKVRDAELRMDSSVHCTFATPQRLVLAGGSVSEQTYRTPAFVETPQPHCGLLPNNRRIGKLGDQCMCRVQHECGGSRPKPQSTPESWCVHRTRDDRVKETNPGQE